MLPRAGRSMSFLVRCAMVRVDAIASRPRTDDTAADQFQKIRDGDDADDANADSDDDAANSHDALAGSRRLNVHRRGVPRRSHGGTPTGWHTACEFFVARNRSGVQQV